MINNKNFKNMHLKPVPPRESLRPKRKQNFYDFAVSVYEYGQELLAFKQSEDFEAESVEDQNAIIQELLLIENLNEFQVSQIESY